MIFYLLERAARTARQAGLIVRTLELSIRYDDWKDFGARRTLPEPTDDEEQLYAVATELLTRLHRRRVALRHVGIVLSGFSPKGAAGRLFEPRPVSRRRDLHGTMDAIRARYGHASVVTGESIDLLGRREQNDYGFVLRTPSLTK